MRISTDRRRRRRPRSRFERGSAASKGRDLIRYRRNRESLAREVTVLLLWGALVVLLIRLGGSLWHVGQRHLAEHGMLVQLALPALALVAGVFALWRARGNWSEIQDIRQEQKVLTERLRRLAAGEDLDHPV